ncbi:MAG: heavy-metal-associated domain-containing protein [Chloroflexi bacterium]|nr:heavy-metal-associated domain-containing protein [Chloroflexota bacterium]
MANQTFSVPNISCNHCVMTIKRELGALKGVSSVDASAQTKQVTVGYDSEATLARVKATLEEIGYPVAA